MKIHDISMIIDESTVTYPGDMKVTIHQVKNVAQDRWNLSGITLGAHTGTHIDTTLHIANDRESAAEIDLSRCYGECIVLDLQDVPLGSEIQPSDFQKANQRLESFKDRIILLKTSNSSLGYREYRDDWVSLSLNAAEFLRNQQIKAVGIDSLTIGNLQTHQALLFHEILIYEGLDLHSILPGSYQFIGFPLKIATEGSFVRAVLIEQ